MSLKRGKKVKWLAVAVVGPEWVVAAVKGGLDGSYAGISDAEMMQRVASR